MIIPNFKHIPGVHCGSTAMMDVLGLKGRPFSEGMCFGLGSGLHFYYLSGEKLIPTRLIHGRGGQLESDLCQNLGGVLIHGTAPNGAAAWEEVRNLVEKGEPVILQSDVAYIPYYQTQSHFNAHRIVLAGFDDERRVAFVADTHFEGLKEISYTDLDRARTSTAQPTFDPPYSWWTVDLPERLSPMSEAIRRSLEKECSQFLEDSTGIGGLNGMKKLSDEFEDWQSARDAAWSARFAYQTIEKRGTGGGLFRKMYARFLRECAEIVPELVTADMLEQMELVASLWLELALELKRVSEQATPQYGSCRRMMREIFNHEERFWLNMATRLGFKK